MNLCCNRLALSISPIVTKCPSVFLLRAMSMRTTDHNIGSPTSGRRCRLYHFLPEKKSASVIFVPGFMSHGQGLKAKHLLTHCQKIGCEFISYDPEGLMGSPGNPQTLEFSHWVEDCELAMQQASSNRILLIGSSLGAMIALKMATKFPDLVWKLLLVAPAVNTLYEKYREWYDNVFDDDTRERLDRGEVVLFQSEYGPMIVRRSFFENYRNEHQLPDRIPVRCPVSIIHGVRDEVVPYEQSLRLMNGLESEKVDVIFRKDGEHRLFRLEDLTQLTLVLDKMLREP